LPPCRNFVNSKNRQGTAARPYADPEAAARKLIEIAIRSTTLSALNVWGIF
jgi:hypothetical protein